MIFKPTRKDDRNIQVGIDIGSGFVKAAAISHAKNQLKLVGFSLQPVKDNVIKAIKDAYAELNITKRKVAASVSGQAVVVRYVEMPSMTPDELKSATRFEAEKVIPYNIDDVILDSCKLDDIGANRMRVVIVAAKKDLIDTQIRMLAEAELDTAVMDVDAFTLFNAFTNASIDPDCVCGLLNVGAKLSNLNIVKGASSYLCRDIEVGTRDTENALLEKLALPQQPAFSLEEKFSGLDALGPAEKQVITEALDSMFSKLSAEVRLSFDFYENRYAGTIGKLYISGGIANADSIISSLKENLGCEVLRWDPFKTIEIDSSIDTKRLDKYRQQLHIATGLALRRTE